MQRPVLRRNKAANGQCEWGAWCWREPGPQPLCTQAVMPSKKFGGGSILLWGCMSANGVGNLCRSSSLCQVPCTPRSWSGTYCPRRRGSCGCTDFILQQDNDPNHTRSSSHDVHLEPRSVAFGSTQASQQDTHTLATHRQRRVRPVSSLRLSRGLLPSSALSAMRPSTVATSSGHSVSCHQQVWCPTKDCE